MPAKTASKTKRREKKDVSVLSVLGYDALVVGSAAFEGVLTALPVAGLILSFLLNTLSSVIFIFIFIATVGRRLWKAGYVLTVVMGVILPLFTFYLPMTTIMFLLEKKYLRGSRR